MSFPIKALKICGAPVAEFRIILPDDENRPALKTASAALVSGIREATGITLAVVSEKRVKTAHEIIIGGARGVKTKSDLILDGFEIRTDENNVYLGGNNDRACIYAAYEFLIRFLGFRFFADDTTVITESGDVNVASGLCISENPVFEYRQTCWQHHSRDKNYAATQRINAPNFGAELGGGPYFAGGFVHTLAALCPRSQYEKEHPEYYPVYPPLGDKPAKRQLCLTNPDVLKIVTENVLKTLRANPQRIVSVSQDDNDEGDSMIRCLCPACKAIEDEEGSPMGPLLRFVNAVADEVAKEFPDVMVETLSYQYTRKPPKKTVPRKNVIIRLCSIECCFRHPLADEACEKNALFKSDIEGWNKICNELYIWDYTTNYSCYLAPFPNFEAIRENARFFAEHGVKGLYEEGPEGSGLESGELGSLRAYLLAKLLWNPLMSEAEYKTHMREFLAGYYGPGWQNIEKYIDIIHSETKDTHVDCFQQMDIHRQHEHEHLYPGLHDAPERGYLPYLFQPVYEEHNYLSGVLARIDEIETMWDAAEKAAVTALQKKHIRFSRLSIAFMKLFCVKRDKNAMNPEAIEKLQSEVDAFYTEKASFGIYTNIWTSRLRR